MADGAADVEAGSLRPAQRKRQDRRERDETTLLLLGPPNSGKSTMVRQMRLVYDKEGFTREREAFRLAIYLTLIRTTRALLVLFDKFASRQASSREDARGDDPDGTPPPASPSANASLRREAGLKKLRLQPLLDFEEPIRRFLGFTEQSPRQTGPTADRSEPDLEPAFNFFPARWRECASKPFAPGLPLEGDAASTDASLPRRSGDPSHILERSKDEVTALYALVVSHGLLPDEDETGAPGCSRLSDSSRYFLDHLDRVTKTVPTDEDIMHLRLKTVGAEEHRLMIEGSHYRIVDVAGAHGTKPVWAPFFEGARAIIFVVSLSSYDEPPVGDKGLPPLESALETFGAICANKLLVGSALILFLNKIDILRRKLKSSRRRPTTEIYRDFEGPANDFKAFCTWTRNRFAGQHADKSPATRLLYTFYTTAVSCQWSSTTIKAVSDIVVRRALGQAGLV